MDQKKNSIKSELQETWDYYHMMMRLGYNISMKTTKVWVIIMREITGVK